MKIEELNSKFPSNGPVSTMVPKGIRRNMILLLMVLTPGIPEYLTGSTQISPLFVNPVSFVFSLALNLGLYSTGALLIREFLIRFNKGWASVLILGAAYGIMEEGISVHTFFQPSGSPVGLLAIYGRYAGINWIWAFGLTVFHAVFSIFLPLLLLSLAYRSHSRESLLGKKGIASTILLYFFTVIILNVIVNSAKPLSTPTGIDYILFSAISIFLLILAYFFPGYRPVLRGREGDGAKKFYMLGLFVFPIYILYAYVNLRPDGTGRLPPILDIILFMIASLLIYDAVTHYMPPERNNKHGFYLAAGLVTPLLIWAEIMQLTGGFPLITIVTVIAIILLFKLRHVVKRDSGEHMAIS